MAHAREASLFATPAITGCKRFAPHSFAPDRAGWSHENRGAMLRVVGDPGDPASHLENRAGEPCANSYLFMASQITAGLDGLARSLDPGDLDPEPYSADRQPLPANLLEAVEALDGSELFRRIGGQHMGPRYLGADVAKYRHTVNVEPCWSIKVVPRSIETWQGLGWAPRYKNPDLHATAGDQQVKPTYYG